MARRSVERDYRFYDPPEIVYRKITRRSWPYVHYKEFYELRDLSLMCLLYLTTSRISEIVRFRFKKELIDKTLASVKSDQFVKVGDFLMLRDLRVHKRIVEDPEDYPRREEIPLPSRGGLSIFTRPISRYLELLGQAEELYPFSRIRAYQVIRHVTGEFPHYLREMGLKFYLRFFSRDLVRLKDFSSHRRLENLARYLRGSWDEDKDRLLELDRLDIKRREDERELHKEENQDNPGSE